MELFFYDIKEKRKNQELNFMHGISAQISSAIVYHSERWFERKKFVDAQKQA